MQPSVLGRGSERTPAQYRAHGRHPGGGGDSEPGLWSGAPSSGTFPPACAPWAEKQSKAELSVCFLWLLADSLLLQIWGLFFWGVLVNSYFYKTFLASSLPSPFPLFVVRAGFPGSQFHCVAASKVP